MGFFKKIIAVFCGIAISFSILFPPAAIAVDPGLVVGGAASVVSIIDFALDMYDRWKAAHPNEPASAYPGYNPGNIFGGGEYGGGAGRDELQAAYDAYVSDLPASGYTSSGKLLWRPTVADLSALSVFYNGSVVVSLSDIPLSDKPYTASFRSDQRGLLFSRSSSAYGSSQRFRVKVSFCAPFSGSYCPLAGPYLSYTLVTVSGDSISDAVNYCAGSFSHFDSGSSFSPVSDDVNLSLSSFVFFSGNASFPDFEVIPDSVGIGDTTYNIATRPTSITGGNYGIVGDNGQIVKVEDNSTIVNETNNTVWNPVTGSTSNITDWSYDYSTRTYTVTLENGTTQTITYGDENITIQEGDTVYNVYYLVDGGSSEETPSCDHNWTETSRTEPTCTRPGSMVSTCSKCQQTKTEAVSALGHDWQVKQTVTTEYDDTGQLVQEGYTIFECSRCQEQYKSTDGTGPPDKPPDSGEEDGEKKGFLAWLWDVLTDSLKKLIEGIIDAILKTLDFFFGGDGQSNADFYNNPSTFSGVSVWD